ncbi:hypothetical protein Tco_0539278 [Tanacetum coccineum]
MGHNISSEVSDEASDPSVHKSLLQGDGGVDSESKDSNPITYDPLFRELLKDENDGLAICFPSILQRHWTSPGMEAALQAAISSPSDRLKQALNVRKRLLNFILAAFHQSPEFVAILKVLFCFVRAASIGKKSCPKMLGSPLTDTVNISDASRLHTTGSIKRHEECEVRACRVSFF